MTTIYIVLGIVVLFVILAFVKEKIIIYEDGIKRYFIKRDDLQSKIERKIKQEQEIFKKH